MTLKINSKAPAFTSPSTSKSNYSLKDSFGKYVVLYFYPKDDTPGCTIETNEFNKLLSKFKILECEVFGISKDGLKSHDKFRDKYKIKFDLIADEELKQTKVTQPAVFLHSVILALTTEGFNPEMVAGHSLGEFSALVANGVLKFEDGLKLVSQRAQAMQKACELSSSTMAAILGLNIDEVRETINSSEIKKICQIANDNAPGQIVISGEISAVNDIINILKEKGVKKAIKLPVSAPFHCDLMNDAKDIMKNELMNIVLNKPIIPIVQNTTVEVTEDIETIKYNLINQVTATVRWRETMEKFKELGVDSIIEVGAGNVLTNLIKRINKEVIALSVSSIEDLEKIKSANLDS